MRHHRSGTAAALLALLLACAVDPATAAPSLEGFWTVKFEKNRSGQALIDQLPEGAVLVNDTGAGELAAGDFGGLRLKPAAIEQVRKYNYKDELKRENTCNAPSVAFFMQAPFPMEIHQGTELIVFKMEYFDLVRVIFLDSRPHPPAWAPHTWTGFSTGQWVGNTLKITTTHMKTTFINRNGPPTSYRGTMVEWITRHGSMLSHLSWVDDPTYFEEPMVRTNNFSLAPGQHVGPAIPFETVDELGDKETGWVPSWPIGTKQDEYAKRFNFPFEITRGGKETLYPEYMKTIERLMKEQAAKAPAPAAAKK